jgi:hypothetical protein
MEIYLSSSFHRRTELRGYMQELEAGGQHHVTSRWLRTRHNGDRVSRKVALRYVTEDLQDVADAEAVVVFLGGSHRGGKCVELGAGLALGKRVITVGDPAATDTTIFWLMTENVATWGDALAALTNSEKVGWPAGSGGGTFAPRPASQSYLVGSSPGSLPSRCVGPFHQSPNARL